MITAPKKPSVFRQIEVLRLSERRVLVILVSPDGDVQNRVIVTAHDYSQSELVEAEGLSFMDGVRAGVFPPLIFLGIGALTDFSALLSKAKQTSDVAERTKLYEEAQVVFKREAPWATIDHSLSIVPMRKEVSGFVQSPLGDFTFENVDIAE